MVVFASGLIFFSCRNKKPYYFQFAIIKLQLLTFVNERKYANAFFGKNLFLGYGHYNIVLKTSASLKELFFCLHICHGHALAHIKDSPRPPETPYIQGEEGTELQWKYSNWFLPLPLTIVLLWTMAGAGWLFSLSLQLTLSDLISAFQPGWNSPSPYKFFPPFFEATKPLPLFLTQFL